MIEREVLARVAVEHDDDGDLLVRRFADAGLDHVESDVLLDDLDDGVLDAHRAHRAVVVGLALDLVPRLGPAPHERRARRDDVEHLDQPIIYAVAEPIVAVSAQRAVPEALRRRVPEEIGFVERPEMYRMCRRCTEGVQKVYRRCTEGVQKECTEGLNEKKAAYALTGWLYGPQGMPRRDRAQAASQPLLEQ